MVGLNVDPLDLGDFLVWVKFKFICFVENTVGLNPSFPGDFVGNPALDFLGF